jgi:hypothetical protein
MIYRLLVLHTNGVITAAAIIPVVDSAVQPVLVGIDAAKERAYRTVNAGKTVPRRAYEEAVGRFEKRLVLIDPYGNANHPPADSLLLAITKTLPLPDILAHAVAGKYVVKNKKLVANPDWQEPTLLLTAPDDPLAP